MERSWRSQRIRTFLHPICRFINCSVLICMELGNRGSLVLSMLHQSSKKSLFDPSSGFPISLWQDFTSSWGWIGYPLDGSTTCSFRIGTKSCTMSRVALDCSSSTQHLLMQEPFNIGGFRMSSSSSSRCPKLGFLLCSLPTNKAGSNKSCNLRNVSTRVGYMNEKHRR